MKTKIDKRKIVFDIYDQTDTPFGRWGKNQVDHLFIMRWSDSVDIIDPIIAYIGIDICRKIPTVSYTYMKMEYRRKGLGMYMYEKAIQIFGKLSTNYSGSNDAISDDAKKVWDKLSRKYETKFFKRKGMIVSNQIKLSNITV